MPGYPREKQKEYMKAYRDARRTKYIELLGGVCVKCQSCKNLEFDHINPENKKFSFGKRWWAPEAELLEELSKCQLLCRICHEEKTAREFKKEVEHGTLSGYRRCGLPKCEPCKEAKRKDRFQKSLKYEHGDVRRYRSCKCELCRQANTRASREYRNKSQ